MYYCDKCGASYNEGNEFCLKCGCHIPKKKFSNDEMSEKSKIKASLLQIILGNFGVGNFYLGYKVKAIAQLSLTLLGIILLIITIMFNSSASDILDTLLNAATPEEILNFISGFFSFAFKIIISLLIILSSFIWSTIEGFYILIADSKDSTGKILK